MIHIKKQSGKIVDFDVNKLKTSILQTFVSNHYPKKEANHYTEIIVSKIQKWLEKKTVITAHDIRSRVAQELDIIDPAVSLSYNKHKHIW
jgi:transcriptional regulator NrdR family protein